VRALVAVAAVAASLWSVAPAPAAVAPIRWCGGDRAETDRMPDRAGGPQIHVAYVVPADAPDRFAELTSALATDVAAIDAWWRREDPTRAPRFDLFDFPGCDSRFGRLDITSARIPDSGASLLSADDRHSVIAARLSEFPFGLDDPTKKYLVFYDGDASGPEANVCGTGGGAPTAGGAASMAIIYLRSDCGLDPGAGRLSASVAAHELIHTLGALAFGVPDTCTDDPGHPCDDPRDILYPFLQDKPLDETLLDVGRNHYYAHGGSWFDLQESLWLLKAHEQTLLGLTVGGTGVVRVNRTDCAVSCETEWDAGALVRLVAEPADGTVFRGWTGACAGRVLVCDVTMAATAAASASFARAVRLVVAVRGRGVVTGPELRCPARCTVDVAAGDRVTLRARAASGWRFVRWSGACSTSRPACAVRVSAARRVQAVFARR
jgi:Divergent InlB B-repeat domain